MFGVREAREMAGMSQEALAKKSGLTRQTIWAMETNPAYTTTTRTILAVAAALNVPVSQIFFDNNAQPVKRKNK